MSLLSLMLKEEFRSHTAYAGRKVFLTFPAAMTLFSLAAALTSDRLFAYTPVSQAILVFHLSVFLYGLSVGAFGFLGRQYLERTNGTRNYLVTMPSLLPMRLRATFLGMYLRDAIFYVGLLLAPAALGLALSTPITHFRLTSVAILFGTGLLSFLLGLSLSFFISTIYMRTRIGFGIAVGVVLAAFALAGAIRAIPISWILPGLAAHLALPPFPTNPEAALVEVGIGGTLIAAFVAAAVFAVPDRYEPPAAVAREDLPRIDERLRFTGSYSVLLAKEFVDVRRSGTLVKMFFSFVAPLLFLSATAWFVRYGLQVPVGFNSVFYAAMVGYFGVMLYNWMTNLDAPDAFSTIPLTISRVIRAKLLAFLFLTSWITVAFIIGIAWLNNDTRLLWLAVPVGLVTSLYMVTMTAYLTGLRTNSFLFDPHVLARFAVLSALPDLVLTILSFTLDRTPVFSILGIAIVLVALVSATYILLVGIEAKWRPSEFGD
jgi:hypothetical protein